MKQSVFMVAIVVLLIPSTLGAEGDPVELNVMTYNIGSAAKIPLGPDVIARIAEQIKSEKADIVGMTEVDIATDWHDGRDMVGELAVALARIGYPMHHYYTPTLSYHGGWMVLCLWSRFPIADSGYAVIRPEGKTNWKVASITVEPKSGVRLHAFMTHYCIWAKELPFHKAQTDAVLAYAGKFTGARVIMGDFNFTPGSAYYKQVTDAGYTDSCVGVGGGPRFTVGSGAGKVAPDRLAQIDFIFGSREVKFLDTYVPKVTYSDHWPLTARICIPGKP